jgi:hypothetical protein
VPAVTPWIVASQKTPKLVRCTLLHHRRGSFFIIRDVASTAARRYRATTPSATGSGFQALANGTRISLGPKWEYESATRPAMWNPVKATEIPPR